METMEAASWLRLEVEDDEQGPCCNLCFTQGLSCKTEMYFVPYALIQVASRFAKKKCCHSTARMGTKSDT